MTVALTTGMWISVLLAVFLGAGGVLLAVRHEQRSKDDG